MVQHDRSSVAPRDEALERFCAEAYPRLVSALTHYCGDVHLAEEFAQEALVVACRRWATVSRLEAPVAWTYRVGVYHANSWFRRLRAERRARARAGGHQRGVHDDADGADRAAVRAALAKLTGKQREAVILRYYLGLTAEEAARLTGATPGAIRALTHRAVDVLREELGVGQRKEAPDVS